MPHRTTRNAGTALITGGTSGIGAAFADRLGSEGYDLILTGRREPELRAQAARIAERHGVDVDVVIGDLADPAAQDMLVQRARSTDRLSFLVNNAGFGANQAFVTEQLELHEQMLNVHVLAPMKLIHAALPRMIARGHGRIINVSSTSAFIPYPDHAMYSATKAMLNNLSESLHLELRGTGVRLQVLCPGVTRTDFHAKLGISADQAYGRRMRGRVMTAEDVVDSSLAALARDRPVCVPGRYNALRTLVVRKLPRAWVHRIVLTLFGGRRNSVPAGKGRQDQ